MLIKTKKKSVLPIQIKATSFDFSFVQILGDYKPIKRFLKFKVENARFSPAFKSRHWDGTINLINRNKLMVGNLHFFCEKALSHGLDIEFQMDGRTVTPDIISEHFFGKIKYDPEKVHRILRDIPPGFDPRDYQFDSVAAAMGSKRGMIFLATGGGKSLILYLMGAMLHDQLNNCSGLILAPRISLVEQLEQSIRLFSQNRIIPLTSISHKEAILELKPNDHALIVSTFQSWMTWQDEENLTLPQIKYLIGDEAHTYAGKGSKDKENKVKGGVRKYAEVFADVPIRFGLTATPPDDPLDKLQLEGLFGKASYTKKAASLMKSGYLAKPNIYRFFIKHKLTEVEQQALLLESEEPLSRLAELVEQEEKIIQELASPDLMDIQVRLYRDQLEALESERTRHKAQMALIRKDFLLSRRLRYELIFDICKEFFKNGPMLILGEKLERHLVPLQKFIADKGIESLYLDKDSHRGERQKIIKRMSSPDCDMTLSVTYGLFQMGIDIPTLSNVLMYSPSVSPVRVLQSIGRGLRPSSMCNVFDLIDYIDKIPESAATRKKIYDSEYEDQYVLKDIKLTL